MVKHINAVHRLAMLLAATNISEHELILLFQELQSMPISDILKRVQEERARLEGGNISEPVSISSYSAEFRKSPVMSNEIAAQIERLLIREAGFTKAEAARALQATLSRRHPEANQLVFKSKDGFERWLKLLASEVSQSELLHAAANLRNSRVHGVTDDWLKEKRRDD